ncbi:MAG: hypothetical protein M3461_03135 [Pseudomonadota bacterium]|nr:hypothetical protein [Pseudomonadota bacterium]
MFLFVIGLGRTLELFIDLRGDRPLVFQYLEQLDHGVVGGPGARRAERLGNGERRA